VSFVKDIGAVAARFVFDEISTVVKYPELLVNCDTLLDANPAVIVFPPSLYEKVTWELFVRAAPTASCEASVKSDIVEANWPPV
jgi:hypothetical protein